MVMKNGKNEYYCFFIFFQFYLFYFISSAWINRENIENYDEISRAKYEKKGENSVYKNSFKKAMQQIQKMYHQISVK